MCGYPGLWLSEARESMLLSYQTELNLLWYRPQLNQDSRESTDATPDVLSSYPIKHVILYHHM